MGRNGCAYSPKSEQKFDNYVNTPPNNCLTEQLFFKKIFFCKIFFCSTSAKFFLRGGVLFLFTCKEYKKNKYNYICNYKKHLFFTPFLFNIQLYNLNRNNFLVPLVRNNHFYFVCSAKCFLNCLVRSFRSCSIFSTPLHLFIFLLPVYFCYCLFD